jgi:methylmalonyl-CoA mutase, N-terminal domain
VIAYESGVADVIDPLAGSYFLESLTDRIEELAEDLFAEIDRMGEGSMLEGVLAGIEKGWFQGLIAEAAFDEQRRYETGELTRVGVNRFVEEGEELIDTLVIGPDAERQQVAHVREQRASRDGSAAAGAIAALMEGARGDTNLIEPLVVSARAGCTEGEIATALQSVFGEYRETPVF